MKYNETSFTRSTVTEEPGINVDIAAMVQALGLCFNKYLLQYYLI